MTNRIKKNKKDLNWVYSILQTRVGKENAISATDLCLICGVSSHRELRKIMREIRRSGDFEKIPCSCNKGYYLARTKEEAIKSIDRILNTAKNEFKTGYIMLKKLGFEGQIKILFGDEINDTFHSLAEKENESDTKTD